MVKRKTDRGIQLLRIISCLAVFFCHFGQRLYFDSFSHDLFNFSQLGRFGVELFFVVSGYLACVSLSNGKSIFQFYKKRALKILPLYYSCILYFYITETYIFGNIPEDPMNLRWLRYIFCLNGIVPAEGYFWSNIGITWTIPVFMVFYLIAPLLIKIAKTTWRSVLLLIAFMGLAILVVNNKEGWFSAFLHMPCFLMGIVVYNAKKENNRFYTLLGFQLFVFAATFCEWNPYHLETTQLFELFVIPSIFASIVLVSEELKIHSKRALRRINFLDEHSYTIYLVHGITFCGMIDKLDSNVYGDTPIGIIIRLFISIVVTFFLTIVIHQFVEKPIQSLFNNINKAFAH